MATVKTTRSTRQPIRTTNFFSEFIQKAVALYKSLISDPPQEEASLMYNDDDIKRRIAEEQVKAEILKAQRDVHLYSRY